MFIDYRAFDKKNVSPVYEFGFGLSYTKFEYSDIKVVKATPGPYTPTTGLTKAAPVLGNFSEDTSVYQWPSNLTYTDTYIYPYLNSTDLKAASRDPEYGLPDEQYLPPGIKDGGPQPKVPAGGGLGGNPQLWDVFYTVTATVKNTGDVVGEEVVQMYVSLGGPEDPKVVLRGFERLSVQPGQSTTFTATINRRDLSNWDSGSQNWVISSYPKTVFVGGSSRTLPLSAKLE